MKSQKRSNKQNKIIKQQEKGVLLEGKFQCECHGMLHKLINNCINCGRIVCEQEGEGECQTCGNKIVARAIGQGIQQVQENTLQMEFPAFDQDLDLEKQKAIQLKNTLIKRDKSDFIKNNVFDEQVDWYQIQDNVWQSKENREKAVERLIERNNKMQEIQNSHDVFFDPQTGTWTGQERQFDEKQFLESAREFQNTMTGDSGDRQKGEVGVSNLSQQEKQVYDIVRSEFQEQQKNIKKDNQDKNKNNNQKQSKGDKKNQKKQEEVKEIEKPLKTPKIVQNQDDFYSQFI
ncbi:hypothetical protein PPERSA_05251 [Pseudocohnilembus persalinus]|uniref:TRIP4/RQT4 C2HC5-type zinc finger domain-containing protein n=1 Tax=Pseudocohnilembus persalinus TaxID=266149 RepID=A0A0V0QXM7_PSEPJ|nr:hypothetical protein PPERSA_05251 [Pseudocohnilembus persalinus]|eukprot:KRX07087.1 hypothetical protein PPERSA_05251 [Pseudocohnilembus persalinus]